MRYAFYFLFIYVLASLSACKITMNNTFIDYKVFQTASVEQFETKAANAPPSTGQQFSERFKNKILSDTRLRYIEGQGDMAFSGQITQYSISPVAPQANQTVSFQRLSISMNVICAYNKGDKESWNQTFSRFANFPADADLSTVEDQLLKEIYDQVLEDVFNKSFTGWE